jgi:hypothetical protein
VAGWWFFPGTPVSSTNKTDCHNITEILLLMKLLTITSLFKLSFHKIKIVTNKNEIYYKYEKKIKVYIKRIFKFAGQIN